MMHTFSGINLCSLQQSFHNKSVRLIDLTRQLELSSVPGTYELVLTVCGTISD